MLVDRAAPWMLLRECSNDLRCHADAKVHRILRVLTLCFFRLMIVYCLYVTMLFLVYDVCMFWDNTNRLSVRGACFYRGSACNLLVEGRVFRH